MPTKVAGRPYAHEVWLSVKFTGVSALQRKLIEMQLQRMRGWLVGMTGEQSASLRYSFTPNRLAEVVLRAQTLLRNAGAQPPEIDGFVIWRVDLRFAKPLNMTLYKYMTAAMRALPQVLDTHAIGDNRAGVCIEFRGQPTDDEVRRVRRLAAPYLAK